MIILNYLFYIYNRDTGEVVFESKDFLPAINILEKLTNNYKNNKFNIYEYNLKPRRNYERKKLQYYYYW